MRCRRGAGEVEEGGKVEAQERILDEGGWEAWDGEHGLCEKRAVEGVEILTGFGFFGGFFFGWGGLWGCVGHFEEESRGVVAVCFRDRGCDCSSALLGASCGCALKEGLEDGRSGALDETGDLRDDGGGCLLEVFAGNALEDFDDDVGCNLVASQRADAVFEGGAVDLLEELPGGVRDEGFEEARPNRLVYEAADECCRGGALSFNVVGEEFSQDGAGRFWGEIFRLCRAGELQLEEELEGWVGSLVAGQNLNGRLVEDGRSVGDELVDCVLEGGWDGACFQAELFGRRLEAGGCDIFLLSALEKGFCRGFCEGFSREDDKEDAKGVGCESVVEEESDLSFEFVQGVEEGVLHRHVDFVSWCRLIFGEFQRDYRRRMDEERLAAMTGESMLDQVQELSAELLEQRLLLCRRAQQDQPLHQPRARLAIGNLQFLPLCLFEDVGEEQRPVFVGREVIELEQFVRATKVFLFFFGKEAVEGAAVGFFGEWRRDEGVGGVANKGHATNFESGPLAHRLLVRIRLSLALPLAAATTLFVFFRHRCVGGGGREV